MERRKTLLFATLALSGALLVGCGDDEESNERNSPAQSATEDTEASSGEPTDTELDVGEESGETQVDVGNEADVATGQAGTTSGITGSDMSEADETVGEGLSSRDQMPVSDPAAQQSPTNKATPEEQAPASTGDQGRPSGAPQASSSQETTKTAP